MTQLLVALMVGAMALSLDAGQAEDAPGIDGPVARVFDNRERQYVQFVVVPSVWRRGDWVEAMVYSYSGEDENVERFPRFLRERRRHNCASGRTEEITTEYLTWPGPSWIPFPYGTLHNLPHAGPESSDRVVGALLCNPDRLTALPRFSTIGAAYNALDLEFGGPRDR